MLKIHSIVRCNADGSLWRVETLNGSYGIPSVSRLDGKGLFPLILLTFEYTIVNPN